MGGSDTVVGGEERKRRREETRVKMEGIIQALRTRGPLSSMGESFRI